MCANTNQTKQLVSPTPSNVPPGDTRRRYSVSLPGKILGINEETNEVMIQVHIVTVPSDSIFQPQFCDNVYKALDESTEATDAVLAKAADIVNFELLKHQIRLRK